MNNKKLNELYQYIIKNLYKETIFFIVDGKSNHAINTGFNFSYDKNGCLTISIPLSSDIARDVTISLSSSISELNNIEKNDYLPDTEFKIIHEIGHLVEYLEFVKNDKLNVLIKINEYDNLIRKCSKPLLKCKNFNFIKHFKLVKSEILAWKFGYSFLKNYPFQKSYCEDIENFKWKYFKSSVKSVSTYLKIF